MNAMAVLAVAVALVAAGTFGGVILAHRREERRRWARYQPDPQAGEPPSVVCPHCRRRWYSARVMRERHCPSCGQSF